MAGEERAKKYGKRLKYDLMPIKYLKCVPRERVGEIITNYYQRIFLHKEFGQALNAVIIVKLNLKTLKSGHALLFSSDVELGWEKLIDYYSLRFQIELRLSGRKATFRIGRFYEHDRQRRWHDELNGGDVTLMLKFDVGVERLEAEFFLAA